MADIIRTVLGDIPAAQLGRTDYHEHLLQTSRLLPNDELDDVDRSAEEAASLRDAGIDALVELTPIGLGRDPGGLVAIARRTGMHIVMATGVHREEHYIREHPLRELSEEALRSRFVTELTDVADANDAGSGHVSPVDGVRAGVIKVGIGYWSISPFERRVLSAAGAAQQQTGSAVVCHLELGSAAWEALGVLCEAGASPQRVILAHADRNLDPGLHTELAAAGAYLGYDGMGRTKYWPDSMLIDCLLTVADAGGADRLLLGGDVARRSSFASFGGLPGMAYLPLRFVPRLERSAGPELVKRVLEENPARAFSLPESSSASQAGSSETEARR